MKCLRNSRWNLRDGEIIEDVLDAHAVAGVLADEAHGVGQPGIGDGGHVGRLADGQALRGMVCIAAGAGSRLMSRSSRAMPRIRCGGRG